MCGVKWFLSEDLVSGKGRYANEWENQKYRTLKYIFTERVIKLSY